MSDFIRVAAAADIPPGTGKIVRVMCREGGLFNVQGTFRAIDNICPHSFRPIGSVDFEGNVVTCLWHGLSFNVEDGRCLQTDAFCVDSYPTRLEDGQVWVSLSR